MTPAGYGHAPRNMNEIKVVPTASAFLNPGNKVGIKRPFVCVLIFECIFTAPYQEKRKLMTTNKMIIKGNLCVDQTNKAFESDPPLS